MASLRDASTPTHRVDGHEKDGRKDGRKDGGKDGGEDDVCLARRLLTVKDRADVQAFRRRLACSPSFRRALDNLSNANMTHALTRMCEGLEPAQTEALMERMTSSKREVMHLRVELVVARWVNAICYACLRPGKAVRACDACMLYFYCSGACAERKPHTAFCCVADAAFDEDDPLAAGIVRKHG